MYIYIYILYIYIYIYIHKVIISIISLRDAGGVRQLQAGVRPRPVEQRARCVGARVALLAYISHRIILYYIIVCYSIRYIMLCYSIPFHHIIYIMALLGQPEERHHDRLQLARVARERPIGALARRVGLLRAPVADRREGPAPRRLVGRRGQGGRAPEPARAQCVPAGVAGGRALLPEDRDSRLEQPTAPLCVAGGGRLGGRHSAFQLALRAQPLGRVGLGGGGEHAVAGDAEAEQHHLALRLRVAPHARGQRSEARADGVLPRAALEEQATGADAVADRGGGVPHEGCGGRLRLLLRLRRLAAPRGAVALEQDLQQDLQRGGLVARHGRRGGGRLPGVRQGAAALARRGVALGQLPQQPGAPQISASRMLARATITRNTEMHARKFSVSNRTRITQT